MEEVELDGVDGSLDWMEKPEAWNSQKPRVELTSMKESGPVNSVSSMKPKL
jgi:hypothetical protein